MLLLFITNSRRFKGPGEDSKDTHKRLNFPVSLNEIPEFLSLLCGINFKFLRLHISFSLRPEEKYKGGSRSGTVNHRLDIFHGRSTD